MFEEPRWLYKNRIAVKFSNDDTSGRRVVVARRQESIEKEVPSVVVCMCGRERAKRERTNEKESNKANLMNGRPNFFWSNSLPPFSLNSSHSSSLLLLRSWHSSQTGNGYTSRQWGNNRKKNEKQFFHWQGKVEKRKKNNSIINQFLCPIRMTCKWQAREALCETHVSKFNWMLILSGRTKNKRGNRVWRTNDLNISLLFS